MRTGYSRRALLALGFGLAVAACGPRGPTLAQLDAETLLARGMTAFQDEDWDEAIRHLERLSFVAPTHPRIGEIRYRLAQAHFSKREYITAATEYGRLANEMPSDTLADDARWGVCRSYRRLSPNPQLDQEYTYSAMNHCDALVQLYPESEFAQQARNVVREMRDKLGRKVYQGGDWYFRRNAFDSAIIYFEDVVDDFPDTPSAPAALLRLHQIYTLLEYEEEATAVREQLLSRYPDSPQAMEVRGGPSPAPAGPGR